MKMKQLGIFVVMLSLLVSLVTGCQPRFQPGPYTDDMGRVVSIDEIPQRIVSHVPSITEILFVLGLEERVVGVDDYSDYPEEAKSKPSVGNYFNPSIENIVALDPDLVLTDGHSESIKQLDELGINYLVLQPKDIDGILKNIELVGRVTATERRAREVVEEMKDSISQVADKVKGAPRVRVFYTFATTDLNNPWTAGPGTFIDSLLAMAGGENIAAKLQVPWAQISIEEVVAADPDIIILSASMGSAATRIEALRQHPIWREMTAVKQSRVYTVDSNLVNRSGPRIVQALQEIARMIHPELFK